MTDYRPLLPSDVEGSISLISDVYSEMLGRNVNKFVRDEVGRILEDFQEGSDLILLVQDGGELVGTVIVEHSNPSEGTCNIQFLTVKPDHRGRGHGRELMTRALEFARSAGYKTAELHAMRAFDFALTMYEDMGFKHVDTYLWQETEVLTLEKFL
jgi:putative acetyltransferase